MPRMELDQAVAVLERTGLAELGARAAADRRGRFGDSVFWVRNVHLNYTNVCRGGCKVCHYYRDPDQPGAYTYTLDEILQRIGRAVAAGAVEVHIVGGVNPDLAFSYYLDLIGEIRRSFPHLYIKAFTAVEIDHLCQITRSPAATVLTQLIEKGLNALPGGGAEVFAPRVRRELFPHKISGERWLDIHRAAHRLGLRTTATLLFGHQETLAERIDHLLQLRRLQDETNGFVAFVPFPAVGVNSRTSVDGLDALRTLAVSRLVLDNIDHLKVFWPIWGLKLAQLALSYGADDFDGTVGEYKIVDQPGLPTAQLRELICQAGFTPVERDGRYQEYAD